MASKRRYPIRICINHSCKKEFEPHDFRQEYCDTQCRINFHNDDRRRNNLDRYRQEPILRRNDQILELLMKSPFYTDEKLEESVLLGFEVNMNIGTLEENLATKRPIRWFHAYGLELVDKVKRIYTIHYRTKFNI